MSFRIVEIRSPQNPFLREIRQSATRGCPTPDGLVVAEGPHLVEEILHSKWTVVKLIFTPETLPIWERFARRAAVETIVVPARTFQSIAETQTSQGVMAIARPRRWTWRDLDGNPGLLVVLDGIQDPGNAGTIIRSADAFGASGVVLLKNSVHLSNGKLMRASAGSAFYVPVFEGLDATEFLSRARELGLQLFSLDPGSQQMLASVRFAAPCALIVGSEANGISPALLEVSVKIAVKTTRVESLNAAVACSIALYESNRQRGQNEPVRH